MSRFNYQVIKKTILLFLIGIILFSIVNLGVLPLEDMSSTDEILKEEIKLKNTYNFLEKDYLEENFLFMSKKEKNIRTEYLEIFNKLYDLSDLEDEDSLNKKHKKLKKYIMKNPSKNKDFKDYYGEISNKIKNVEFQETLIIDEPRITAIFKKSDFFKKIFFLKAVEVRNEEIKENISMRIKIFTFLFLLILIDLFVGICYRLYLLNKIKIIKGKKIKSELITNTGFKFFNVNHPVFLLMFSENDYFSMEEIVADQLIVVIILFFTGLILIIPKGILVIAIIMFGSYLYSLFNNYFKNKGLDKELQLNSMYYVKRKIEHLNVDYEIRSKMIDLFQKIKKIKDKELNNIFYDKYLSLANNLFEFSKEVSRKEKVEKNDKIKINEIIKINEEKILNIINELIKELDKRNNVCDSNKPKKENKNFVANSIGRNLSNIVNDIEKQNN